VANKQRKMVGNYEILPNPEGQLWLNWRAHLGDSVQARTEFGKLLTVRFATHTQRDNWLTNYNGKKLQNQLYKLRLELYKALNQK
jgi:hypothetical protein